MEIDCLTIDALLVARVLKCRKSFYNDVSLPLAFMQSQTKKTGKIKHYHLLESKRL